MSADTQAFHCRRFMLAVSLSHNMPGHADGGGTSQSRTAVSALPDIICCPSGLNATLFTLSVCPVNGCPICLRVPASHNRRVLSELPDTIHFPSGLNATLVTVAVGPVSRSPICLPLLASHIRRLLSAPPETIRCPSGLNATLYTLLV